MDKQKISTKPGLKGTKKIKKCNLVRKKRHFGDETELIPSPITPGYGREQSVCQNLQVSQGFRPLSRKVPPRLLRASQREAASHLLNPRRRGRLIQHLQKLLGARSKG